MNAAKLIVEDIKKGKDDYFLAHIIKCKTISAANCSPYVFKEGESISPLTAYLTLLFLNTSNTVNLSDIIPFLVSGDYMTVASAEVFVIESLYLKHPKEFISLMSSHDTLTKFVVESYANKMDLERNNNQLNFERKYGNKAVFVKGISDGVSKDMLGDFNLLMRTNSYIPAHAYFLEDQSDKFSMINKGEEVNLVCKIANDQNLFLKLESCLLISN